MKYCFKLILLLFLFSNISFSQFYAEEEISPYIIEFMKIADNLITSRSEFENPKEFAEGELEHIAELYFKCFDKNPVDFYKYIEEKNQQQFKRYFECVNVIGNLHICLPPKKMMCQLPFSILHGSTFFVSREA